MAGAKTLRVGAILLLLMKLVHPQAANGGGLAGPLAAMTLIHLASGAIGQEQSLDQRRRQGGRGQQHARAQQSRPMHKPRQRGQVGHVEIVRLVQHQVAGHEPQHGRDLAAAAQALGGGRQVVYGASQHGRGNQRANLGIVGQTLQQRMPVVAFEQNLPAFIEQRLARGRARRLGPGFPVFEQGAAGGAADLDGQLLIAQAQIL